MSHRCFCWGCHPEWFPRIPDDEGARYIAIQDERRRSVPAWSTVGAIVAYVLLDGVRQDPIHQSGRAVVEALAGNGGWIVWEPWDHWWPRQDRELGCPCGSGLICQQVTYGAVEVRFNPAFARPMAAEPRGLTPEGIARSQAVRERILRWMEDDGDLSLR